MRYEMHRTIPTTPGETPTFRVFAIDETAAKPHLEGVGYVRLFDHADQAVARKHVELLNDGKRVIPFYGDGDDRPEKLRVIDPQTEQETIV